VLRDPVTCSRIMRNLVDTVPHHAAAAFLRADSTADCTSTGPPLDIRGQPRMQRVVAQKLGAEELALVANPAGPMTGLAIPGVSHVVRDAQGQVLGAVGISVPYSFFHG